MPISPSEVNVFYVFDQHVEHAANRTRVKMHDYVDAEKVSAWEHEATKHSFGSPVV